MSYYSNLHRLPSKPLRGCKQVPGNPSSLSTARVAHTCRAFRQVWATTMLNQQLSNLAPNTLRFAISHLPKPRQVSRATRALVEIPNGRIEPV